MKITQRSHMNTKTKYMIPAFTAVFPLMFTVAAPYAMAEGGDFQMRWYYTSQKTYENSDW